MNDTHQRISIQFRRLIMMKSNEERLLIGCSMYDAAKQIVKSSIYSQYPKINAINLKEKIFLRFYGMDFSNAQKEKISGILKEGHASHSA